MVEGLLPLPELHQDVDVAFRGGLAPHDRPEDADAYHAVAFRMVRRFWRTRGRGCISVFGWCVRSCIVFGWG